MLSYTLCIIQQQNKLAMLFREKHPNKNKWNFVGGKIEQDEKIIDAAKREAEEETSLTIHNIQYRGIVKWNNTDGMYVYYSNEFDGELASSNEGNVEWKEIDWILTSHEVVRNIHYFLPFVLDLSLPPKVHHFYYDDSGQIKENTVEEIKEVASGMVSIAE